MDYIFGIWVGTEIGKKIYDKFRKQPPKPPEGKEPYTPPYTEPEKPKPMETPEPSPEIVKRITGGDFPIKEPEPITIEDLFKGPELIGLPTQEEVITPKPEPTPSIDDIFKGPELIGLPTPDEVKEPGEEISGGIVPTPTPHRAKKTQPKPDPYPVKKPEPKPFLWTSGFGLEETSREPSLRNLAGTPTPEPSPEIVKRITGGDFPIEAPTPAPSPIEVAGAVGIAGGIATIGSKIIESIKRVPVPGMTLTPPSPQIFEPAMKALGVKIHSISPIPVAAAEEVKPHPRSRSKARRTASTKPLPQEKNLAQRAKESVKSGTSVVRGGL
jgi:hypothetical protein